MSADGAGGRSQAWRPPLDIANPYQDVYEQLLALADKVGAAYADAYERIRAGYSAAYGKAAVRPGGVEDMLGGFDPAAWLGTLTSAASGTDPVGAAKEHALTVAETVREMARNVGLAYLDAGEKAAVAAAKAQEEIGRGSSVDVVKSTAVALAELAHKVTEAGASTIRELID